jgi:hypothetical protein
MRTTRVGLALFLLSGCGSSLEGEYSGTVDCGEELGTYDMDLTLYKAKDGDEGSGVVSDLPVFGEPGAFQFSAFAVADGDNLDLTLSDCALSVGDSLSQQDCQDPGPWTIGDGDSLSGNLPVLGIDCAAKLEPTE